MADKKNKDAKVVEGAAKPVKAKKTAPAETKAEPKPEVAAAPPPPPPKTAPKKVKIPKLAKKNKSRLPRRQKKALQKG